MIETLTDAEIEELLRERPFGFLGCNAEDRILLTPITYVYADGCVYGHTYEGEKIRALRERPDATVLVEDIRGPSDWRSVQCWGHYEELHGAATKQAMHLILEYLEQFEGQWAHCLPPFHHTDTATQAHTPKTVFYKINIDGWTGRREREQLLTPEEAVRILFRA